MAKRLGRLFSRLTRRLFRADVREFGDETNNFPVEEAESEPSDKEDNGMVRALITFCKYLVREVYMNFIKPF